jgi:hypothetical protein
MTDNLHNAPPAFNLDFREGFSKEISKSYKQFCEDFPYAKQEERIDFHKKISEELKHEFPSIRELQC